MDLDKVIEVAELDKASEPELVAWKNEFRDIRRTFHKNPEIGLETIKTSELIAQKLREYGVDEVVTNVGGWGVVGVVQGNRPSNKSIGLRADIDALPMQELGCHDHVSLIPGKHHGCGHDGHGATLLAVAKYLASNRDFPGRIVLIFQPGEEGYAGAKHMMDDGLFTRFPVDEVYAYHNYSLLPVGKVALNYGAMQAAADLFKITVTGKGGHASRPHFNCDPVLAASNVITALQSIVSRNVDPNETAVVSCCSMVAGDPLASSVCPEKCVITGTARTYNPKVQDLVEKRMAEIIASISAAYGCEGVLEYTRLYPPCINTPEQAKAVADVAEEMLGEEHVSRDFTRLAGGEDFAFMLQEKPGAYFRVGQAGAPGHNGHFDFNDDIIPVAATILARVAKRRLEALTEADQ